MNLLSVKANIIQAELTEIQRLQYENQLSILKNFLIPLLYNPKNFDLLRENLSLSEKIFMGFKDLDGFLARISYPLYVANRFFYASSGPRYGRLLEDLFRTILERRGYQVSTRVEIHDRFNMRISGNKYIDFVFEKGDTIHLVELRTSEHTGGRTGQESLLDKFREVIDEILRGSESFSRYREIHMRILILFGESHQVLNRNNVTRGRLTSLINYVLERDNLGSRFARLSERYSSSCEDFRDCLERGEVINFTGDRKITFGIWVGDELFSELLGNAGDTGLRNFLSEEQLKRELGDDLWIMFTVLPYEMRNYYLNGFTWVQKLYDEVVKSYEITEKTEDEIIGKLRQIVLHKYSSLPLLETNDLKRQLEYLDGLISSALVIKALGPETKLRLKASKSKT